MSKIHCQKCNDTGFADGPVNLIGTTSVMYCECHQDMMIRQKLELSGLKAHEPVKALDDLDIDNQQVAYLVERTNAVMSGQQDWLAMRGNFGTGKTTALMTITRYFAERGVSARYYTLPSLFGYLKDGFGERNLTTEMRLNQLLSTRVLCLDELDKISKTDWANEYLMRLVNDRYRLVGGEKRYISVFAMNDEPDLPHIFSRMFDRNFPSVIMESEDWRQRSPVDVSYEAFADEAFKA